MESTRTNINERIDRQAMTERDRQPMLVSHCKPTEAERWERFEAEYTPANTNPSAIKRQIETAKYGLDTAVFAVDRFVKNVESQADFSFDQGGLRHTRANSRGGFLDNPRMKLDLNMWQNGKPLVGVRVIIPFGN